MGFYKRTVAIVNRVTKERKRIRIKNVNKPKDYPIQSSDNVDIIWKDKFDKPFDDTIKEVNLLAPDNKHISEKLTLHDFHNGIVHDIHQATLFMGIALIDYIDHFTSKRALTREEYLNALETKCNWYTANGAEMTFFLSFIRGLLSKKVLNKDDFIIEYLPIISLMFLRKLPKLMHISAGYHKIIGEHKVKTLLDQLKIFIKQISILDEFYYIFGTLNLMYANVQPREINEDELNDLKNIFLFNVKADIPDILLFIDLGWVDFLNTDKFLMDNEEDSFFRKVFEFLKLSFT